MMAPALLAIPTRRLLAGRTLRWPLAALLVEEVPLLAHEAAEDLVNPRRQGVAVIATHRVRLTATLIQISGDVAVLVLSGIDGIAIQTEVCTCVSSTPDMPAWGRISYSS